VIRVAPSQRLLFVLGVLAALVLLGLLSGSRLWLVYGAKGRAIPWGDAVGSGIADWLLWGPLLVPLLALCRRVPLQRGGLAWRLGVHVPASVVFALAHVALYAAWSAWVRDMHVGADEFRRELGSGLSFVLAPDLAVYWAAVLGLAALRTSRDARDEALRRARLDEHLAAARLEALTAWLRPHFLFNTLNTIAAQLREDPLAAERMLHDLADLLRRVLARRDVSQIPLREELQLLESWLAIQRVRYEERLVVEVDVSPDARELLVPVLLLQPLVENAVEHGVATRAAGGWVRVSARREGGRLHLSVHDDGPGPRPSGDADGDLFERGLGLSVTRDRLRLLHGDDQHVRVTAGAPRGTLVDVDLPAETA